MTIVWSPRAIANLTDLRTYIARDNPRAAARTAAPILKAVERLAEMPQSGRPGRIPGTREYIVPATPYVMPYRARGDRVEIIAVFHGRRKWPASF